MGNGALYQFVNGRIPRLTDNAAGYGPKGKNYIAHVEIPTEVRIAFEALKQDYADLIRLMLQLMKNKLKENDETTAFGFSKTLSKS